MGENTMRIREITMQSVFIRRECLESKKSKIHITSRAMEKKNGDVRAKLISLFFIASGALGVSFRSASEQGFVFALTFVVVLLKLSFFNSCQAFLLSTPTIKIGSWYADTPYVTRTFFSVMWTLSSNTRTFYFKNNRKRINFKIFVKFFFFINLTVKKIFSFQKISIFVVNFFIF